jgi:hypothetical protein
MEHAAGWVLGLIATLAALVIAAIVAIEHFARSALGGIGIVGDAQSGLLIVLFLLLAVAALRLFGRLFIVLVLVFLVLWLFNVAVPHRLLLWDPAQGIPA